MPVRAIEDIETAPALLIIIRPGRLLLMAAAGSETAQRVCDDLARDLAPQFDQLRRAIERQNR
jgi:hypothetical protein